MNEHEMREAYKKQNCKKSFSVKDFQVSSPLKRTAIPEYSNKSSVMERLKWHKDIEEFFSKLYEKK